MSEAIIAELLPRLDERTREGLGAATPAELAQLWASSRAAWPAIALSPERFCRFLGERGARLGARVSLHARDLYLACAILDGDAAAVRAFDALLDEVARKLRRPIANAEHLEEAKQRARLVIVSRDGRAAPLDDYSGRGELGGWLRIVLARELLAVVRAGQHARATTGELAAIVSPEDDPETRYLKSHYRREFKESFAAALAQLADDERRLLRYALVERLGIDDVARLERTHRATAARRVARARARLAEETRRLLQERLRVEPPQLASILRLVSSQLDLSVRRLLRP